MSTRLLSLVVFAVLIAGCGGAGGVMSYDADRDVTRYETSRMTVAQAGAGGNFASQTSIRMRVGAECSGRECVPEEARMAFTVEGQSDVAISSRQLTIEIDDQTFEWGEEESWNRMGDMGTAQGRIVTITLPLSDLEAIAQSSSIEGSLGNKSLDLGGIQSELQTFVQTARNPSAAGTEGR